MLLMKQLFFQLPINKGKACCLPGNNSISVKTSVLVVCLFSLFTGLSMGQIVTPLHVCCEIPIVDEFGIRLQGTQSAPGDLVQVLWATNGVINPPDVDGTPHPDNAVLYGGETGIGALASPYDPEPGIFGISIREHRPQDGDQVFVRVFNHSEQDNATFYADSQLLTVNGNSTLTADFNATTNALDPRDPDYDGLNNSWEKTYGSDPDRADTDGDGQTDGHEQRAGTDLLDAESLFQVATFIRIQGRDVEVGWESVSGKTYRVEFTPSNLTGSPVFSDVSSDYTADSEYSSAVITNGLELGTGCFRTRLVE
jgi:hypothetical protein